MQTSVRERSPIHVARAALAGAPARVRDRQSRSMLLMVVLTLASSAILYASNLIFSRVLTPAMFGDLTALLALSVVVAVPTGAAQTVIAARVASYHKAGRDDKVRYLARHALAHMGAIGTVATIVYSLLIPVVYETLELQALGPAIALVPLMWQMFVVPIVLGLLQGMGRFVAFGLMSFASAAARPLIGVPWAEAGGGAGGAIAGQALGSAVVLIGALWILRPLWFARGTGAASSGLRRRPNVAVARASVAFIAFAVISNLDIVLAKAMMDENASGQYAALATIAKVLIFLPGAVAIALVPSAAKVRDDARLRSRTLRIAALAVFGATLLIAIPALIDPALFLRLMFGDAYADASSGVLPMVFAGTGLALLNLLVVYSVAIEDRRWWLLLVLGVGLQAVGISLFHGSPTEVAAVQAAVVGILLLVNEAKFHSLLRPPRTRS